jgi:hypothetical protein
MAASEDALGSLHDKLATILTEALEGDELPGYTDKDPETGEETWVPPKRLPPSAAIITAAAKFLKDNNITCSVSTGNKMDELKKAAEKREAARLARRATMVTPTTMTPDKADFMDGLPLRH